MRWVIVALLPVLAGCGPGMPVTKVDSGTAAQLNTSVKMLNGEPPEGARLIGNVEATSCKNKAWDPAPTTENAIVQMKALAQKRGGNALGNLYCEPPMGTNLGTNCWSSVRCTATAYLIQ